MSIFFRWLRHLAKLGLLFAFGSHALAATVYETTQLLPAANAATNASPVLTFDVPADGDYTVTLTDAQAPAALTTLSALVTRGLQKVATLEVIYSAGNAAPTPATATFTATAGTYRLHVLGIVADNPGAGTYAVRVAPAAGGTALLNTVVPLSANSQAANQSVLLTEFTVAQAGTYQLVVNDHAFPAPLAARQIAVLQPPNAPITTQEGSFSAQPGTYTLIISATADEVSQAGLYSVIISGGPSSSRVLQATRGVGRTSPVPLTVSAGQLQLTVADVTFPNALDRAGSALIQNDALLGKLDSAGTTTITTASGSVQLFAAGVATTTEGIGAYSVKLTQGAVALYETVRIVDSSPDPRSPAIYSVTSTNSLAPGGYRINLKDVGFPAALTALQALVTQGATVIGRMDVAGEQTFSLQAVPVKILIAARPAPNGTSLFALQVSPQAGGASVLETTQGVAGLFHSAPVTIQTAGRYDLTLTDLQFPESLDSAALAITQGTSLVGQIFGTGSLAGQDLTPGIYVLNFQGAPASSSKYGAYGLRVADSSPAPTLSFTATPTSVTAGQQATLQWSTTDATACTASNGWSGVKATSGTQPVGPLTTATTFELSCAGPGGSTNASVVVAISAARKRGGGGAFALPLLGALTLLTMVRLLQVRADPKS